MKKTQVLLGFLLIYSVAAYPTANDIHDDDIHTQDITPYNKFSSSVFNDDNELVQINLNEDDPETEEETRKDLKNRVSFFLYTRMGPSSGELLYIDDETALKKSKFDQRKPTKIITHGWINSRKSDACVLVRDAYMKHGDYNIIVVDWSSITHRPYIWASRRVKMVGQYVSAMIDFLEKHGMDLSETSLVGHSLGAHVMGLAAHYAKGKVNYVAGLDPALPNFVLAGPGSRIAAGDAHHVEIIHTNAGFLGYLSPIGDTDFYPNGGSRQVGCGLDIGGACSHARAYHFFAESINTPVGFYGKPCESYEKYKRGRCKSRYLLRMGGYKRFFQETGTFFLKTRSRSPYALGK